MVRDAQQVLLFALDGRPDDDASDAMLEFVTELAGLRAWSVSPPVFIDELDENSVTEPGEEPIRTVGFFVRAQSLNPVSGEVVPITVERAEYEDVKFIIERISPFSRRIPDDIVVELAGEAIGSIEFGFPDSGLTETFLGEWLRSIEAREA